jgi:hypothetical protein
VSTSSMKQIISLELAGILIYVESQKIRKCGIYLYNSPWTTNPCPIHKLRRRDGTSHKQWRHQFLEKYIQTCYCAEWHTSNASQYGSCCL